MVNHYTVLENLQEENHMLDSVSTSSDIIISNKRKRKPLMNNRENLVACTGSVYSNRTNKANNHNIMILSDSHKEVQ
jgi:hypothetical protein